MPNWKKVIVSGSDAILNEITAASISVSGDITASAVTASAVQVGDYTEIQSNRLTIADGANDTFTRLAHATYCGVIVDYTIYSTADRSKMRTGTYRAVFNDSEVQDSETMTNDIGDTNGFVISTNLGGTTFDLIANNDIGEQCRVSYTVKPIKL